MNGIVSDADDGVSTTIEQLLREGTRLNNDERFDAARPLYARALQLARRSHGPTDERTLEALNCVALCEFNRGDYAAALSHYKALLGAVLTCYDKDDPLARPVEASILRCQALVRGARKTTIAEIVFRSHFGNEEDCAAFNVAHDVEVTHGDRLDPEGSRVCVGQPVPDVPASVEHRPSGVQHGDKVWTIETRWLQPDGTYLIERRFTDGTVERVPA